MFNWFKRKSKIEFTPIPTEYKEKAWEYQQVAGLLCQDIDVLVKICENGNVTKENMLWHIKDLQKSKNEIIQNKQIRDSRYSAACFLANIQTREIVND